MTPPVGDIHVALALLGLAVGAALLELIAGSSDGASAAAWDRFLLLCQERGVSSADSVALQAWAQRAGLAEPSQALLDRTLFDRFVRDRVADLGTLAPGSQIRSDAIHALGRLRRRLGHTPPLPPSAPISSHDLLPGIRATVRPDALPSGNPPAGHLVVGSVDAEGIELRPIENDPGERSFYDAAAPGRGCWVTFGRSGEAIYRFRGRVLARPGIEAPSLLVAHGDFLVKEKRRRSPRVPLRSRARVLSIDGDASRAFDAETLDLSFGGVALACTNPPDRGARLAAEITLDPTKPAVAVTIKVVGKGIRAVEGSVRTFANGQFVELSSASREQISSFVRSRKMPDTHALPQGSPV